MDFVSAVKSGLANFVTFSGRASRSEYWWFYLFTYLASIVGSIITAILPLTGILVGIALLALTLPSISVLVRRLHDTGRSGWWIVWTTVIPWLLFTPFLIAVASAEEAGTLESVLGLVAGMGLIGLLVLAGAVTLFIFTVLKGTSGDNKYGSDPLIN